MKIDCLCITTSKRKRFKNWLLWNYLKQNYRDKTLVVVSDDDDWPDWVTFVKTGVEENIPTKRNIALSAARGDAITWFDDDDWQHVNKLAIIADHVAPDTNVGCSRSFFFDLFNHKIARVDLGKKPIFNSIGVARYGLPAFAETKIKYSDTDWLRKLEYRGNYISDTVMSFWITHHNNTSNPIHKIKPSSVMDYYLDGETWLQLKKLRARLLLG